MAYRIFIDGNFLVITGNNTTDENVRHPAKDAKFRIGDQHSTKVYIIEGIGDPIEHQLAKKDEYKFSQVVDKEGNAFESEQEFKDLLSNNLAFSRASGSGASSSESVDTLFKAVEDDDGNIVKVQSLYDVQFPAESIELGDSVKISDSGQTPSYTTKFDGAQYLMMGYEFGGDPTVKHKGPSSEFELQPFDSELLQFSSGVEFSITSQQDVVGEVYVLKMYAMENVRLRVYRSPSNEGTEALLVDQVIPQEELSLDGFEIFLSPLVHFSKGKVYKLLFTTGAESIQIKGTTIATAGEYGVSTTYGTNFFPYIRRDVGYEYTEKNLTHVDYENVRPLLLEDSSNINELLILKEHHKKRLIVSDGSKKLKAFLPSLSSEDDGWTCQIVNLTDKILAIGGYKFKNGGSISIAYLAEEDRFSLLGFEANGGQILNPDVIEKVDVLDQAYDVTEGDDGFIIDMKYNGNWLVNLPNIDDVETNFEIYVIHKQNDNVIGNIVAYSGDQIDGLSSRKIYGQGFINLKKIKVSNNNFQWLVFNQVSYNTVEMQGKTRRLDFVNQSTIELPHDLGFIPIIQVWVEDGAGGYTLSNAVVVHDWQTMNSSQISFGEPQTGKIIY